MKTPTHRVAFTIVELLVVIAIIGVLVSLLLPALGKAREAAKLTQCTAQMRSIGQGLINYATDQRGNYFPSTLPQSVAWMWKTTGDLLVPAYLSDYKVFYCPNIRSPYYASTYNVRPETWGTAVIGSVDVPYSAAWPNGYVYLGNPADSQPPADWSYWWVDVNGNGRKDDEYVVKLDQDNASNIALLAERGVALGLPDGWDVFHPARIAPDDSMNLGGNNTLYADSHVGYKERKDIVRRWTVIGW